MSNDIRIRYRGEFFWGETVDAFRDDYGWYVDMPDGSVHDNGNGEDVWGFCEYGPFQTLREAYNYAVPPESEGQW